MVDIDPRVVAGLRELAGRAPLDSDVWPATEHYVVKHRRRRRGVAGAAAVFIVAAGGLVTAAAVHNDGSKAPLGAEPTSTTVAPTVLSATGPVEGSLTITAGVNGRLTFSPAALTATTGIASVTLVDGGDTQHSLRFEDPSTLSSDLVVNYSGERETTRVFFGQAGDYTFFCVLPGHRAAGMEGVVHVTGPAVSLGQAEADGTIPSQ